MDHREGQIITLEIFRRPQVHEGGGRLLRRVPSSLLYTPEHGVFRRRSGEHIVVEDITGQDTKQRRSIA